MCLKAKAKKLCIIDFCLLLNIYVYFEQQRSTKMGFITFPLQVDEECRIHSRQMCVNTTHKRLLYVKTIETFNWNKVLLYIITLFDHS